MYRVERAHRTSRALRGFTLLEIVIALVLSAGVLLAARRLTEILGEGAARIAAAGVRSDREANAVRLLRSVVEQIEVGAADGMSFEGTAQAVRFTSWCAVPDGWWERCAITLSVGMEADGALLSVTRDGGVPIPLVHADSLLGLRYLANASGGGSWFERWGEGTSTPLAVGVVRDTDTLIVRIGDRG